MVPWVKHLLCKPESLSYSPGIIVKTEGENQLQMYSVTYIPVHNPIVLIQEKNRMSCAFSPNTREAAIGESL